MSFNKVIINDEVKLDLSQDTAAAANVEKGFTFHNADGDLTTGTLESIKSVKEAVEQVGDVNKLYCFNATGFVELENGVVYKDNSKWVNIESNKYYELLKLMIDDNIEATLTSLKTNYPTQFNTLLTTAQGMVK